MQSERPIVTVVGSNNAPNTNGLRAFIETAWPQVKARVGTAELHLYGTLAESPLPSYDDIHRIGYVEDLKEAYHHARVMINPTQVGSGLKIKSVEALCHGKALITAPPGADGMQEGRGSAFLVAESLDDFGQLVAELLVDDPRRRTLEEGSREFAEKNFSREAAFREIQELLRSR